jgi:hypothetical protein
MRMELSEKELRERAEYRRLVDEEMDEFMAAIRRDREDAVHRDRPLWCASSSTPTLSRCIAPVVSRPRSAGTWSSTRPASPSPLRRALEGSDGRSMAVPAAVAWTSTAAG